MERNVKAGGRPNSKIPSIFDHRVRNPSTIESNYHFSHITWLLTISGTGGEVKNDAHTAFELAL